MMLRKRTSFYLSGLLAFSCVSVSGSMCHAQPLYHQLDTISHEPGVLFDVRKAESAAAVSTVSGERLYQLSTANLSNTLYGLLPGVTVNQGTGQPGNDAASLWIRGIGSYNYGDYAIFIDGFQVPFSYFQNLLPSELESISVLKDAAALAPLGMKGANGALWVTTKRGAPGKPRIQLQARTGFQQPTHLTKPLGSYDYARLYNEAISNDAGMQWNPIYSTDNLETFRSGVGTNTDWYGEVLKNSAPFTTADVTLNGGNETARYFVMLGYLNNQGLYRVGNDDTHANAGLQQFNARTRLDFDLYDIFEGNVSVSGRTEDRRHPNYDSEALWNNLARYPALIYPAKNGDGTWPGLNVYPDNPLASIRELGYQSTHDRTLQASISLKEKLDFILPGLYIGQSVSFNTWTRGTYNINKNYARIINGQNQTTDQNTNYQVFDDQGTNQWNWTQFQLRAGYEQQWDMHNLHIAANYLQYAYNVDASQNGAAGINTHYAFQNLGGRMRYVYGNRYVAEFGFAYSGSDNYAKGNRFGFFPTISAAWVISEEAFLHNSATINQLKIRGSVGKSGYDNFQDGRYLYQLYYAYSGSYATGNDAPTWQGGLGPAYTPNLAIFAEQSMKYNIGVDARLFSALDITVDAFLDKRSGIVTPDNSLLAVLGTPPPYTNIGKVTNRGIEMNARFAKTHEKWGYWLGAMAAFNKNRIDYMAEITPATPRAAQTGRPIATYFGYQADGFYDVTDFDANGGLVAGRPVPSFGAVQAGDIRYHDINGDNIIDEQDMVAIGDTFMPRITYALSGGGNFGGLDLQVLLQGAGRRSVNLLDTDLQTVAFRNNGNAHGIALGRWAYYPDQGIDTRATASYPRLSTLDNANNYRNSSFWITDGSFLRIRHIELGYRFSPAILQRVGIERLRVFANGVNLATWSNLLRNYDMDPETMSGYAAAKSVNFGFTVGF